MNRSNSRCQGRELQVTPLVVMAHKPCVVYVYIYIYSGAKQSVWANSSHLKKRDVLQMLVGTAAVSVSHCFRFCNLFAVWLAVVAFAALNQPATGTGFWRAKELPQLEKTTTRVRVVLKIVSNYSGCFRSFCVTPWGKPMPIQLRLPESSA